MFKKFIDRITGREAETLQTVISSHVNARNLMAQRNHELKDRIREFEIENARLARRMCSLESELEKALTVAHTNARERDVSIRLGENITTELQETQVALKQAEDRNTLLVADLNAVARAVNAGSFLRHDAVIETTEAPAMDDFDAAEFNRMIMFPECEADNY